MNPSVRNGEIHSYKKLSLFDQYRMLYDECNKSQEIRVNYTHKNHS
jgi:hypothetical protein